MLTRNTTTHIHRDTGLDLFGMYMSHYAEVQQKTVEGLLMLISKERFVPGFMLSNCGVGPQWDKKSPACGGFRLSIVGCPIAIVQWGGSPCVERRNDVLQGVSVGPRAQM